LPPFVDAKNVDGTVRRFSVYKKGTSITVRSFGLSPYVSHQGDSNRCETSTGA
jgi:hypothetical protein